MNDNTLIIFNNNNTTKEQLEEISCIDKLRNEHKTKIRDMLNRAKYERYSILKKDETCKEILQEDIPVNVEDMLALKYECKAYNSSIKNKGNSLYKLKKLKDSNSSSIMLKRRRRMESERTSVWHQVFEYGMEEDTFWMSSALKAFMDFSAVCKAIFSK